MLFLPKKKTTFGRCSRVFVGDNYFHFFFVFYFCSISSFLRMNNPEQSKTTFSATIVLFCFVLLFEKQYSNKDMIENESEREMKIEWIMIIIETGLNSEHVGTDGCKRDILRHMIISSIQRVVSRHTSSKHGCRGAKPPGTSKAYFKPDCILRPTELHSKWCKKLYIFLLTWTYYCFSILFPCFFF